MKKVSQITLLFKKLEKIGFFFFVWTENSAGAGSTTEESGQPTGHGGGCRRHKYRDG